MLARCRLPGLPCKKVWTFWSRESNALTISHREKEQDLFTEIQMLHQKIDESKFGIDRNASAALKKDLAMKYKKALVDSGRVRDLAQQCLTALIPYAVGRVEEVKQAEDDFKAEIAGGGDNNIWEHVQRNIQLQNGLQVAFREEEDKWILARIKRYDPKGRKRYEVEDADPKPNLRGERCTSRWNLVS